MVDTGTESEEQRPKPSASVEAEPQFRAIVHRTLERELERRRELGANAQLGVCHDASPRTIDLAYRTLCSHYQPRSYARYGLPTVALAQRIVTLLGESHAQLRAAAVSREGPTTAESRPPLIQGAAGGLEQRASPSL